MDNRKMIYLDDAINALERKKDKKAKGDISGFYNKIIQNDIDALMQLPPAQPEIIHCGDCRYKDDGINEDGIPFLKCLHGRSYGGTRINDFCSWAERGTDE
jgi:hypothetical protein